jgi:DNA polymerase-1
MSEKPAKKPRPAPQCSVPTGEPVPIVKGSHVYLIDGSGYIFRAFHALPPMSRADGTPTNAVFGFSTMLMKLLEDAGADHLAVIFDAGRESFRNEI